MAITRFGVQPVIATVGDAQGTQIYLVGEVAGGTETTSLAASCTNDLGASGNLNVVHWQGSGDSYRVYKAKDGGFGLIGTTADALFLDTNIEPDMTQAPPQPSLPNDPPA